MAEKYRTLWKTPLDIEIDVLRMLSAEVRPGELSAIKRVVKYIGYLTHENEIRGSHNKVRVDAKGYPVLVPVGGRPGAGNIVQLSDTVSDDDAEGPDTGSAAGARVA